MKRFPAAAGSRRQVLDAVCRPIALSAAVHRTAVALEVGIVARTRFPETNTNRGIANVAARTAKYLVASLFALGMGAAVGSEQQAKLDGVYSLNAAASDDIKAAIDKGTADMNFLIRGIARDRIAETNPAYKQVEISRDESTVSVQFDKGNPIKVPLDGSVGHWTSEDGTKDDVTAKLSDAKLVLLFKGGGGQRVDTFDLAPDGKTLQLHIKITASRMPAPVAYKLVYQRQGS
jgi:hypothetical protein